MARISENKAKGTGTADAASGIAGNLVACGSGSQDASLAISGAVITVYSAGNTVATYTAGETISALRCAVLLDEKVYVASSSDATIASGVLGISTTSANQGSSVQIQSSGYISDESFSWQDKLPIFLAADGKLTQTPPASGMLQVVAIAAGAHKLLISIRKPIIRAN